VLVHKRGWARLIESGVKKGYVLLQYSSDEFESTLTVYWNGVEACGILYRPCHKEFSLFEEVLFAGE
jgi:hypothetical protein